MYKDFYSDILNVTCTNKSLTEFLKNASDMQLDAEKPFEKYYNLRAILTVIERYKAGRVSVKYLVNWIKAYYVILVGGQSKMQKVEINLKSALRWAILDWIGKLSFFNEFCNVEDLDIYVRALVTLDRVYGNAEDCSAIFSEFASSDYDTVALAYNGKRRYFIKIYVDTRRHIFDEGWAFIDYSELKIQEKDLVELGFEELKYLPNDL